MPIIAFGQLSAQEVTKFSTIPALILKRSERSIPGLRAIPAEIKTMSAFTRAGEGSSPEKPSTLTGVGMWLKSAATPGVTGAISYKDNSVPAGKSVFSKRPSAWPIPPAAPNTTTFIYSPFK